MTTPVLQVLHEHFPDAWIDIVADRRSAEIFEHCPYRGTVFFKHKKELFRGSWSLLVKLRKSYYDLIVDLRTDGLAYLLRGGKRLTRWHIKNAGLHSVEQHMNVIKAVCVPAQIPLCHIWLSEHERYFADHVLDAYRNMRLLGIGPGANSGKKIWPAERFVSLINLLSNRFDAVILFGGKRDRNQAGYIDTHIRMPCINLCEKTSLLEAAAVMNHIGLYIGNDSGLGHMAAAMGTPTMTIFGPGEPERYRPWGKGSMVVVGDNHDINCVTASAVAGVLENEYFRPSLSAGGK